MPPNARRQDPFVPLLLTKKCPACHALLSLAELVCRRPELCYRGIAMDGSYQTADKVGLVQSIHSLAALLKR